MLVVFLPYFGVGEEPMIDFYSNLHSEGYLHSGGPTLYTKEKVINNMYMYI